MRRRRSDRGTPYTIAVPVGWPLDIVLEPGEQIHNIVGGDRAPTEAMLARIARVPFPATDPVHGEDGPLTSLW